MKAKAISLKRKEQNIELFQKLFNLFLNTQPSYQFTHNLYHFFQLTNHVYNASNIPQHILISNIQFCTKSLPKQKPCTSLTS